MVVGLAIMAPLYLFLHLLTSGTVTSPTKASVAIEGAVAKAIGVGVFIGYVLPTVFMTLPSPSILPTDTKITAVVFWQAVPLWASVCAYIASMALGSAKSSGSATTIPSALRLTYLLSIAIATITHLATFAISTISSDSATGVSNLLIPPNPFNTDVRISSFLEGATWFLQWDYIMMSLAYFVWAITVRHGVVVPGDSGASDSLAKIIVVSVIKSLLMGPIGAALSLVWERDQLVWELEANNGEKELKGRPRRMSRKWMFT